MGALGRYAISLLPVRSVFPWPTLFTNILGALLIGFIVGISEGRAKCRPNAVLFWKTGVCGGFTTFSTFSLEAFNLLDNKMFFTAVLYIALSVSGCLLGIVCGRKIAALRF